MTHALSILWLDNTTHTCLFYHRIYLIPYYSVIVCWLVNIESVSVGFTDQSTSIIQPTRDTRLNLTGRSFVCVCGSAWHRRHITDQLQILQIAGKPVINFRQRPARYFFIKSHPVSELYIFRIKVLRFTFHSLFTFATTTFACKSSWYRNLVYILDISDQATGYSMRGGSLIICAIQQRLRLPEFWLGLEKVPAWAKIVDLD